jgi:hypothetical protein
MAQEPLTDDSPGADLFPEYSTLYGLIVSEVEGLTDVQLDFESERWEWSKWSIRRQLRHMEGVIFGWLVVHWGETLFPDGENGVRVVGRLTDSRFDRMDRERSWETPVIMAELKEGIDMTLGALAERSVSFLREHTYIAEQSPEWNQSPEWKAMLKAHPAGLTVTGDPAKTVWTLEATIRHVYFEEVTHLYNIQRLKRAQGLHSVADLPRVGYWVMEGWDTSEPQ